MSRGCTVCLRYMCMCSSCTVKNITTLLHYQRRRPRGASLWLSSVPLLQELLPLYLLIAQKKKRKRSKSVLLSARFSEINKISIHKHCALFLKGALSENLVLFKNSVLSKNNAFSGLHFAVFWKFGNQKFALLWKIWRFPKNHCVFLKIIAFFT